jgi:hypothetical protein
MEINPWLLYYITSNVFLDAACPVSCNIRMPNF